MQCTEQKIAVVTGGGSGIGFAIAEKFVANNIKTVIIGRSSQKLDEAKQKLGDLCQTVAFDLTNLPAIPALVEELAVQHSNIDINK